MQFAKKGCTPQPRPLTSETEVRRKPRQRWFENRKPGLFAQAPNLAQRNAQRTDEER